MKEIFLSIVKHSTVILTLAILVVGPFQPLIAQAQTPPATTPQTQNAGDIGCSVSGIFSGNSGGTFALCLTNIVYVFTVGIGSGFAYVSAYFFDWAVALSLNGSAYALDFVSQGWTTARDLANMAFLFILLYIAFKIIFSAETGDTIHMLALVIVVALLVNFSFFFTRIAIDAGNILAIQFYNAIDAPAVGATAGGTGAQSNAASAVVNTATYIGGASSFNNSKDLTASIMGMLQLQNLFNTDSFSAFFKGGNGTPQAGFLVTTIALSFLYIAAAIMFWLITVAFITNGVKFLVRIVVLWFLIIASPLAFVARAVPAFEKYYNQWQSLLISHAFYPAAFMFIFLILTNFSKQMGGQNALINGIFNGLQGTSSAGAVASIGYAVANVGIRMGFVIAMLYIGMEASKRIGIMGASAAENAGNWVGGRLTGTYGRIGRGAGAVVAGVPAALGRNTIGFVGDKYAKSNFGRNAAAQGGLFGRSVWRAAGAVSRQSFDARGALVSVGAKENVVGKAGGQGGYTAKFDARVKRREEEAKKLKPSESKILQAQTKAIKELSTADKKNLADLADKYVEIKDAFDSGAADRGDVKNAKKALDAEIKRLGIIEKSRQISGHKNDKVYADSVDTKSWRNMWGAAQNSGIPLYIRAADKEASARIRGAKNDAERLKNVLGKLGVKP